MIFDWIKPKHLSLPDAAKTANYAMWSVAVKLLRQIEQKQSPAEMQKSLSSAIICLNSAYSLAFPGKKKYASSDYIVPALILVLLSAKL